MPELAMADLAVQLVRRFVPASPHLGDWEFLSSTPSGKPKGWHEIEELRRVLILADPGAGKTFEALARARRIAERGEKAFFLRIEAIGGEFENAFEVGSAADFAAWLASDEQAWFFLDSVDEAQLETPRALENAIQLFGGRIAEALQRSHIFITSREDAWRALSDRTLVDQHLPYFVSEENGESEDAHTVQQLEVYRMAGLSLDQIKLFAAHYGVGDINGFVAALERANLMELAERPFDLKALIRKWQADQVLGGRLEVLQRMIALMLAPLSAARANPKIEAAKALDGARALAAAATLTGKSTISLPGGVLGGDRIDSAAVLPEWTDAERDALLRSGVFDDIVYASVRFRHREIRELLTAEWANVLLALPGARAKVEGLFFRTSYGEEVLVPRLRPVLAWLLLFDAGVRDRALALEPEIASEGGDPSELPLDVRRDMLTGIVERIAAEQG
jgi:hypothetical protein